MKKLEIDFAARVDASAWVGRVLLVAALAFSLDVALSYKDVRGSLARNEAKVAALQASSPAPRRQVSAEEAAVVLETVERLAMPWNALFGALESAASEDIALLGIEPDPKAGTVVISGDSRDYLAALAYVLNLERAGSLGRVQLVRHDTRQDDPHAPVHFAVSATWSKPR